MCVDVGGENKTPSITLVIRLPLVPYSKLELHVPGHTLVGWSTFMEAILLYPSSCSMHSYVGWFCMSVVYHVEVTFDDHGCV